MPFAATFLGAGAWGWPREMLWGGRWEGSSCFRTHVRIKDFKIKKIKINGHRDYYSKWSQIDKYMILLKCGILKNVINELIYKTETDSQI